MRATSRPARPRSYRRARSGASRATTRASRARRRTGATSTSMPGDPLVLCGHRPGEHLPDSQQWPAVHKLRRRVRAVGRPDYSGLDRAHKERLRSDPSPIRGRHGGRRARALHDGGAARRGRHGLPARRLCARERGHGPGLGTQGPDPSQNGASLSALRRRQSGLPDDRGEVAERRHRHAKRRLCESSGTLDLATAGPIGGNGPYASTACRSRATAGFLFTTSERLVPEDPDTSGQDIYQWQNGGTTLISGGSTGQSSVSSFSESRGIADGRQALLLRGLGGACA